MSNVDLDGFRLHDTENLRKLAVPKNFRPLTSAKILAGTDVLRPIKKLQFQARKKLGVTFFREQSDPYINTSVREDHIMNKMYVGEQGVHTQDEFTKLDLRDHMDKCYISHLSNNRNFDHYKNYISTNFSDLEVIFGALAEMFIAGLVGNSREIKHNKCMGKFKSVFKMKRFAK